MDTIKSWYIFLLLVLAVGISGVFLWQQSNARNPEPTPSPQISVAEEADRAGARVEDFYNWYIQAWTNNFNQREFLDRAELTQGFKQKAEQTISSFEYGGYDPFLCAQDIPSETLIGVATVSGEQATLNMEQSFSDGKRLVPIELVNTEEGWQINNVACDRVVPQQGLETQTITVYFSNLEKAGDQETDCSLVYGVERTVPRTYTTARTALRQLFQGPTQEEIDAGYSSMFSSETADILIGVRVENGVAYVNLNDIRELIPNASTSCGSQAFFAQVEETLTQFDTIDGVIFAIEGNPETFYEWMQIGCVPENDNCNPEPFQ